MGIAAAMAVPFVHTLSRTSWVALLAGIIVLAALSRDRAIAGFLVLVIALVVTTQARDRFDTFFGFVSGDVPSSWQARVDGWRLFLLQKGFSPLIGEGIGRAPLAIDSEYVKQLYELGILGLGLFAWIVTRCMRAARRLAAGATDERYRGFANGYLAGLTALLVHSIAAPTFTSIRTAEPFFIATGLIYAALATLPACDPQPELPRQLMAMRFARTTPEGAQTARV